MQPLCAARSGTKFEKYFPTFLPPRLPVAISVFPSNSAERWQNLPPECFFQVRTPSISAANRARPVFRGPRSQYGRKACPLHPCNVSSAESLALARVLVAPAFPKPPPVKPDPVRSSAHPEKTSSADAPIRAQFPAADASRPRTASPVCPPTVPGPPLSATL